MNMKLLSLLEENKNFDMKELEVISSKSNKIDIALGKYKKILFSKMNIPEDFKLAKNDLENLFVEPLNESAYEYIIEAMDVNNWTIHELFDKCQRTGFNIMMTVGVPNRVMA